MKTLQNYSLTVVFLGFILTMGCNLEESQIVSEETTSDAVPLIPLKSYTDCISPPDGLVSWWTGDGNANDIVNSNHGTLQGGATFGSGLVGQAFNLDGIDDFVDVPDSPNLNFGTNDFTVDLWVKFNTLAGEQILIEKFVQKMQIPTNSTGWTLTKISPGNPLGDNAILFSLHDAGMFGEPDIIPDTWYHVAVTRNNDMFDMYWDGVAIESFSHDGNLDNTSSLKFGHRGNPTDTPGSEDTRGFYLNGFIDEVEIYNRALSASEIQAIYNAGSAGKCKFISVDIDIKPGSYPNCFNNDGHGVIPVAILGSVDFDVTQIDPASVQLEGLGIRVVGKSDKFLAHIEDVNSDGYDDLVVQIEDSDRVFEEGTTIAKVTGNLKEEFGGTPFEGFDEICIVP